MEPTIYKPSIYNGNGVNKNGASGAGNDKILFYTNFGNFDINDNIDFPLIGDSYEVIKESYITLQKKDYCLSFEENQNSNLPNRAFKKIEGNTHTRIIFDINQYTEHFSFFWFSEYIDQSDFGGYVRLYNGNQIEFLIIVKNDILHTKYNLTFVRTLDLYDYYKTNFEFNGLFIIDIFDDENNRHVFLNGYKILDLPPKNELYLRPSPRNLGSINIYELITYK